MAGPVKIRKKNSFMFTTKHYSPMSIAGIAVGVFCAAVTVLLVFGSFKNAGKVASGFGGIGLFSACLNVIGIVCGISSLGERDVYLTPGVAAIVINGLALLAWIFIIVISYIQ